MWTFATLVAGTVNMKRTGDGIDPEFVVIMALYVKITFHSSLLSAVLCCGSWFLSSVIEH